MSEKSEKKKLTVSGMHCKSCEMLITDSVMKIGGVKRFKVDYAKGKGEVEYDPEKTDIGKITHAIEEKGYECEQDHDGPMPRKAANWKSIGGALGFMVVILGALIIAQSSFISAVPDLGTNASLILIFTIGLLTGFHCIGMCGGFMVSYTAKNAIDQELEAKPARLSRFRPHLSYSAGKLISYSIVGAFFGLIGSFFAFSGPLRGAIAVIAGALMIIMGLSMLNIFPFLRKLNFSGLGFLGKRMRRRMDGQPKAVRQGSKGPFTLGLLTGLMPCGPLMAMELYAAGTGNMFLGALGLLVFGLGTLPVMNIFGAALSVLSTNFTKRILKASALIVVILGVIMISRGMTLSGVGFNMNSVSAALSPATGQGPINITGNVQHISMVVDASGWTPDRFVLKKGVPVQWTIDVRQLTSCNNEIIVPAYNLDIKLKQGLNTVQFTPDKEGVVSWSCWMGMIPGSFIVKGSIDLSSQEQVQAALSSAPSQPAKSGGCGCGMH